MITQNDIKKAIEFLNNPSDNRKLKSLHKQLVMSLEVYIRRGEFSLDGNVHDAILCLELAGYEVENHHERVG